MPDDAASAGFACVRTAGKRSCVLSLTDPLMLTLGAMDGTPAIKFRVIRYRVVRYRGRTLGSNGTAMQYGHKDLPEHRPL